MTERKVQELVSKPPRPGESAIEWTDITEDNLKLCVYPSGKASWRQRGMLNGKKVFITIAPVNVMNLVKVREVVRKNKELLLQGVNPNDSIKHEESPTLASFIERDFLPYAKKKYKSMKDVESRLNGKIIPQFGHYRLDDIKKAHIVRYHEKLHEDVSAITANRTLSLLSSVLKRSVDLEIIERNPATGIKKFYEGESRDRVLGDQELKKFLATLRKYLNTAQGKALYLMVCTGARRGELLSSKWCDLDLAARTLYIPDPKNRKPRYLAINSQAYELLCEMEKARSSSPFLFPSNSAKGHLLEVRRTFARIIKEAGIDNLRGHDLRRTNASLLINGGARLEDVRVALGHEDIRSTLIYARLSRGSMAKTSEIAAQKIGEAMGSE
jgi:integrase